MDDVFFIWLYGKARLLAFFDYVNSYHQTIKYTWEWSKSEVSYLDVKFKLKGRKINTDVYSKPTDTHQYLDFKCCHPKCVKEGIPYGQALRLKRICNSEEVLDNRLNEVRGFLLKRGFRKRNMDSRKKEESREAFCSR